MINNYKSSNGIALKTLVKTGIVIAIAFTAIPALAAGGGSGGGGTGSGSIGGSSNSPRYDPVKEYKKGVEYLNAKEYKKASRAFGKVLKVARKDANTNYLMGLSYTGQEKPKKAARYYKSAVRYNANLSQAHIALSKAYLAQGKADKAQQVADNLDKLLTKCGDCSDKTALETARSGVQEALGAEVETPIVKESFYNPNTEKHVDLVYFNSIALINQARYQEAIVELDTISASFGPHPDVMNYLGYANRKLGRYARAESYYMLALAVDPDHKGANEYLGELYVETGQIEKAKNQLARLEQICTFGCVEENELRGWIVNLAP